MSPDLDDLKREAHGHTGYGKRPGYKPPKWPDSYVEPGPAPRGKATRAPVDPSGEVGKKDRGMTAAATRNTVRLELARSAARKVAREGDGTADVERVRDRLMSEGHYFPWENWAGSIFKTGEWVFTGRWVPALHDGGHARSVRVWRLQK